MRKITFFGFFTAKFLLIGFLLFPAFLSAEVVFFSHAPLGNEYHSALLRVPSIDVLYAYSTQDNKEYMLYNFGSYIPGITLIQDKSTLEIGGLGGVFTRFKLRAESFNFIHADFLGGAYCNLKTPRFLFENQIYHVSSHIGDDAIYYDQAKVENTGYEGIKHFTHYQFAPYFMVYLGIDYKFSKRPEQFIFYDKSVLFGTRADFYSLHVPLFFEWELEWFGQASPNLGIKVGIYLKYIAKRIFLDKTELGRENHQLSLYFYHGYSKMGYFYHQKETLILFGPSFKL